MTRTADATGSVRWWRRGARWEHLCVLAYVALLGFAASRHAYWADELQAWLLARDGSIGWLLGHEMRYEGNPGLWHLLLLAPAHAGLPLVTLSVLAGLASTVGVVLFLYRSPFPAPIRALFPFTYFALFQYGVVARPYVFIGAATFAAALAWRQRFVRPRLLGIALGVLSLVAVQGMVLAGGIAVAHGLDLRGRWGDLDTTARRRQVRTGLVLAGLWGLLVAELLPAKDSLTNNLFAEDTSLSGQLSTIGTVTNGALAGWWFLTLAVVLVSILWSASRRRLRVLILTTVPVLLFAALRLHSPWHEGFVLFGWLFAIWVTLEAPAREPERRRLGAPLAVCVAAVFGVQVYWTSAAVVHASDRPYAPAAAAAAYLRANGLEHAVIYGAVADGNDFYLASLDAYFDGNILANYHGGGLPAYYTWRPGDVVPDPLPALSAGVPDLLVVTVGHSAGVAAGQVQPLARYTPVAYFHGYLTWKDGTIESEDLLIERRSDFGPGLPLVGGCPRDCGSG